MLCSCILSKRTTVMLISTHHYMKKVENMPSSNPRFRTDYNKTMGGRDTLYELVKIYVWNRVANWRPILNFYLILDVWCYNASVCLCQSMQTHICRNAKKAKISRPPEWSTGVAIITETFTVWRVLLASRRNTFESEIVLTRIITPAANKPGFAKEMRRKITSWRGQ